MVVKHHENKKNTRNQKIKKTGQDRCDGKYFPGKVYLGDEITIVDKTGNCKGQEDAKNDHGNSEQYEKIGYGVPLVLMCKNLEKTTVNINIRDKGWMIAHVVPNNDCLYRALMSRRAIFMRSS